MPSENPEPNNAPALSEQARADAFKRAYAAVSEGGSPRVGQARIPPKAVIFVALTFAVLGIGGAVLEHFYGGAGSSATSTTTTTAPTPPAHPPSGPSISVTTRTLMSLKGLAGTLATPINLLDQRGEIWNLASARGKAVVLTFYDRDCNDICPVIGSEILRAEAVLGSRASSVEFVIVNADPKSLLRQMLPAALKQTGLDAFSNVFFLTGTLKAINAIWVHYGVTIKVGALATQVVHNNVMYFIDPTGRLKYLAVPFGNESAKGVYSLGPEIVRQFATGIAATAVSLAK